MRHGRSASCKTSASRAGPFFATLPSVTPTSEHFERILVPVDFLAADDDAIAQGRSIEIGNQQLEFAPASIRAVKLAGALAAATEGRLLLVHATPPMHANTMYTGPVTVPGKIIDEIHAKARETSIEALDVLAKRYAKGRPVEFEVRPGIAVHVVLEEAERFNADLIVMAASGRSRVARFFVGSTADRVIRQAGCPVLVIPAEPQE